MNTPIDKIRSILDFIINSTRITTNYLSGGKVHVGQFFCLGLLERLLYSSIGLQELIKATPQNIALEYSAGLIVRTTLLDFLTILKAYDILAKGQDEKYSLKEIQTNLLNYFNQVMGNGLNISMQYVEDLVTVGQKNKEELDQFYKHYAQKHSRFLEDYNGNLQRPKSKYKDPPKTSQLFRQISQTKALRQLVSSYDTYLLFSKYEHYNVESMEALESPTEEKLDRLKRAVETYAMHNFICLDILVEFSNGDEVIAGQYLQAGEFVKSIKVEGV